MKAVVNKIIPFSSVDGPGNRMVIFLQGCNFNCSYCHNPETINLCSNCGKCISACEYNALYLEDGEVKWSEEKCGKCDECIKVCEKCSTPKTKVMSVEDIMRNIMKYKMFIQGVTVSGGECSLQVEFIKLLFSRVKEEGLTTFMDTNGSLELWKDEELLKVTDKFMLDIKSTINEEHLKLTGKENLNVMENLIELGKLDKLFEIRTVVVPEILKNEENIRCTSSILSRINPNIRYKIIKYREHGVRKKLITTYTPDESYMDKLRVIAESNGCMDVIVV